MAEWPEDAWEEVSVLETKILLQEDRIKELERRLEEALEFTAHSIRCAMIMEIGDCDCGLQTYSDKMWKAEQAGIT